MIMIRKLKSYPKGFVTGLCLVILSVVSVLMMSLGSIGIMNLGNQQSYRTTSVAQYSARAAVSEALAQLELNEGYGVGAQTAISIVLNNNVTSAATLEPVALLPCNPCPSYYSVNNLSGATNTQVTDGLGYPVPGGYVKINGAATYQGKTVLYSVLAAPLPYAILGKGTITAGTVNGDLRNNVTAGTPSITVTNPVGSPAPVAVTPDPTANSIVGHVSDKMYGAPQIPIPDIPVTTIAQDCGVPGSTCAAQGCTNVTGSSGLNLVGPGCWYSTGSLALNNGHGGLSLTNGAKLYVNGDITYNGAPTIGAIAPDNLIVCSGTLTTHGNLSGSNWQVSLILGGVAGQDSWSNNGAGGPNVTGFVYSETGNFNLNGGNVTGNIMAKNGTVSAGNVSYDPSYMKNYTSYFTDGIPLLVVSSWSDP